MFGLTAAGIGVLFAGATADRGWLDRHFLPNFSLSHADLLARGVVLRATMIAIGVGAICAAWRLKNASADQLRGALWSAMAMGLAVALALGAGELMLRTVFSDLFDELRPTLNPLRQANVWYGWDHVPGRVDKVWHGDRHIEYAMNAFGERAAAPAAQLDSAQPTILFSGESYFFGYLVPWEETVPAQVGALTGMQTANLAMEGFSVSQTYLRLAARMPQFERPAAVISIFLPSVFYKMLDKARPRVDADLNWLAPQPRWRLALLTRKYFPYANADDIEEAVRRTRAVLRATAELARARGAASVIVAPQVLPEGPAEAELRRRVLDDGDIPYIRVPLQPDWHVPGDGHPDARGTRALAEAIAAELRRDGVVPPTAP